MKKRMSCLFVSIFAVALTGCSSDGGNMAKICVFPRTEIHAPGWVCGEPLPEWDFSASGFSAKSSAGLEFQEQQAAIAARVALAQRIKAHVSQQLKQFAAESGAVDDVTEVRVEESLTKQITDKTLAGSQLVKSTRGPDGTLWMVAGIDAKAVESLTRAAVKGSYDNDQYVWKEFQGTKSLNELADRIATQKVAEVSETSSRGTK